MRSFSLSGINQKGTTLFIPDKNTDFKDERILIPPTKHVSISIHNQLDERTAAK